MSEFLVSEADRREVPVTKNIPWIIYVGSDTVYRHVKEFEVRVLKRCWLTGSTSVLISVGAVFVTVDSFKDFLGVPASVWHALFMLVLGFSAVASLITAYRVWADRKRDSVDYVVRQISGISSSRPNTEVKLSAFQE